MPFNVTWQETVFHRLGMTIFHRLGMAVFHLLGMTVFPG